MRKGSLKEETEYRSGMYSGVRSGAPHARDGKSGNTGETLRRPRHGITRDANPLSRKTPGYVPDGRDFKGIRVFYKNRLMKR